MRHWTWLILFLSGWLTLQGNELDTSGLDTLVIQDQGRKKPFYAFAIETAQAIHGRATVQIIEKGTWKYKPMNFLLSVWFHSENWENHWAVLVDHLPLLKKLGLDEYKTKHISYYALNRSDLPKLLTEIEQIRSRDSQAPLTPLQGAARLVGARLNLFQSLSSGEAFKIVPHPTTATGAWLPIHRISEYYPIEKAEKITALFSQLQKSFNEGNQGQFTQSAQELSLALRELNPNAYPSKSLLKLENIYWKLHPFRLAWIAFALAALILMITSLRGRNLGYRIGWALVIAGFLFQIFGFISRILISGRPPVTNMYETVIWLAFGVTVFAIVLESIYRCRYFLLSACPVAVVALILADSQPVLLVSSINPLTPVLRSNFWLTVHVLTITLSYAAFALALGVGHIILGKICFMRKEPSPALYNYLYRAMQIGVLLLAIGTILGGVWANYSWGRFWDWDPKETWALVSLLSYLFLLHGRIAGWWGGLGLVVGSIICFQTVLMAWYGVNFILARGLHSYGFGSGGLTYVIGYVILELAFVAAALWQKNRFAKSSFSTRSSEV